MQIISTIALYNYKVPITMKKNSHFVQVNQGKTFQIFSGLSRTDKTKFKDFQDSKKN